MFVGVESAEEVKAGLAAMRFKSQGRHAPRRRRQRAGGLGHERKGIQATRPTCGRSIPNGELVNWTIVESKEGLAHVREIAAVKGIGVLWPGAGTLRGVFSHVDRRQARACSTRPRGKRRFSRCSRRARSSTCRAASRRTRRRHRDAHEAGLQRVRDELGRPRVRDNGRGKENERRPMNGDRRTTALAAAIILAAGAHCVSTAIRDHGSRRPRMPRPITGRAYVALSKTSDGQRTPIQQTGETGVPLFGVNIDELGAGKADRRRRAGVRISRAEPARHSRRRVLGAAVRQRLHEVRARRRPHRLAAHGPVGGTALAAFARQHLRRAGEDHVRSASRRRRSSSSRTR